MRIHHLGFVVSSIEKSIPNFQNNYMLSYVTDIFEDKIQKVRVCFLANENEDETQIELIEPLGSDSPVSSFLEKGGGYIIFVMLFLI